MENITQESLLFEVESKLAQARKEKAQILTNDKKDVSSEAMEALNARISSLVLIKSELIRENKNNNTYHLTKDEEISLLNNMAEKRKQNVRDYARNGRGDLAKADYLEQLVIEEFLPKMPSEEEMKQIISDIIDKYAAEEGITSLSMRDMGKIKPLVAATYPTVNGGVIKDVLMSRI